MRCEDTQWLCEPLCGSAQVPTSKKDAYSPYEYSLGEDQASDMNRFLPNGSGGSSWAAGGA